MRNFFKYIFLLPFIIVNLYSANVGDVIENSANISYKIGNVEKNITTNKVSLEVAKTFAKIEFLAIDPTGDEETLRDTNYNSGGQKVSMPEALLPTGEKIDLPSKVKLTEARSYSQDDLVVVRVKDLDQNKDANKIDTITIDVTNPRTGEKETLYLQETSKNSGVFVGYFYVDRCKNSQQIADGKLCIEGGDKIGAEYYDESSYVEVEAKADVLEYKQVLIAKKEQNKDIASIGEFVKYTLTFENIGNRDYAKVEIVDNLPSGLKYKKGSFKVDGKSVKPQILDDGLKLSYVYPLLKQSKAIEVSYVAIVTPNAIDNLVNETHATINGYKISNSARSVLKIKRDLDYSRGYIYGQVYKINCDNNMSDVCGVSGIKLYMEDGRYVVTDKRGRYHFVDVKNGSHIVAIDTQSLDSRYKVALCKNSVKFANRGESQFVDVYRGGLYRADFCLIEHKQKKIKPKKRKKGRTITETVTETKYIDKKVYVTKEVENNKQTGEDFSISIDKKSKKVVTIHFKATKSGSANFYISPGLYYIKSSVNAKFKPIFNGELLKLHFNQLKEGKFDVGLKSSKYYDKEILAIFNYKNQRSDTLRLGFDTKNKEVVCITKKEAVTTERKVVSQVGEFYYTKDEVDKLGKKSKFVYPPKNWVPSIPSTRVAVLYPKDGSVKLSLNGKEVSLLNYEGVFKSKNSNMKLLHYKGVDLKDGLNVFEAVVKDKNGKVVSTLKREVFVENHAPAKIEFIKEKSKLIADGKSDVVLAFKMIGASNHPLRGGLVGSFETDSKHTPKDMVNDKGRYVVKENGIAYVRLKPTINAGVCKVKFTLFNKEKKEFTLFLKPKLTKWIVVGFVEGTVGYRVLSKNTKELKRRGEKEGFYVDGRVAFFAKGQIKGDYLVTIAYDSGKNNKELFDEIDKSRYYDVYVDSSKQGNDAQSRKKLYLKIEKNRFSALFGDFSTDFNGGEFTNYNRSYTGLKVKYIGDNISLVSFIAKSDKVHKFDTIKPDGTTGDYYLSAKDVIKGSLKVKLVTRDKEHLDRVINEENLEVWRDYSIDYDRGTIRFYEPIFSTDEKFNPVFIEAEYDVDGDGESKYSYGARVNYKSSNDRVQVGLSAVKENKDNQKGSLVGVDAKIKVAKNTLLTAEYAVTKNSNENNSSDANAYKIELEYKEQNRSAKIYYRKQDSDFGLDNISDVVRIDRKYGVEYKQKISKNYTFEAEAYKESSKDDNQNIKKSVITSSLEYSDSNKTTIKLGLKRVKESKKRATNQIVLDVTKYFLDKKLRLDFLREQNIGNSDSANSKTDIGVSFTINSKVSLSAQAEIEDNGEYQAHFGVEYKPWENTEIKISKLFNKDSDSLNSFNTIALKQKYDFNEFWSGFIGYERGFGDYKDSYNTYLFGLRYKNRRLEANTLLEIKDSKESKKVNANLSVFLKKSRNLAFGFSFDYKRLKDSNLIQRDIVSNLSFAYRIDRKMLILDKFELKDKKSDDYKTITHTTKFINNLHINYNYNDKLELGFWLGLKYTLDKIDDATYHSWIGMFGADALYKVNDSFAIGAQLALLHNFSANSYEYSYGVFLEKVLYDNLVVRVGANIDGFSDSDFESQSYRSKGVYLQLKMKFDSGDVKRALKNINN